MRFWAITLTDRQVGLVPLSFFRQDYLKYVLGSWYLSLKGNLVTLHIKISPLVCFFLSQGEVVCSGDMT